MLDQRLNNKTKKSKAFTLSINLRMGKLQFKYELFRSCSNECLNIDLKVTALVSQCVVSQRPYEMAELVYRIC